MYQIYGMNMERFINILHNKVFDELYKPNGLKILQQYT